LRSLIALVDDLVRRFRYIDKTIACVIAFAGAKILLAPVVELQQRGDRRHHRSGLCRRRRRVDRRRPLRPADDAHAAAAASASLPASSVLAPSRTRSEARLPLPAFTVVARDWPLADASGQRRP